MSYTTATLFLLTVSGTAGAQGADLAFPPGTRITFLTQDATPGHWDHSGCCGHALQPLKEFVEEHHGVTFVPYDVGKLIKEDIPPYYIFNKWYTEPIGRALNANLFVMTQVELLNVSARVEHWRFDRLEAPGLAYGLDL